MNLPEIEYFFLSIGLYYSLYKVVNFFYRNNIEYQNLPNERKEYFQKNIVKTFALIFISLYGSKILFDGFYYNNWDNSLIHKFGYIYSALDILGLIVVKNLPMNSKIHHCSSFLFSYLNTLVDYTQDTFWIGLPVYCILSSYAFGVNYYLAQRLITPHNLNLITYNILSYGFLLGINWMYQIFNIFVRGTMTWDVYLFVGLVLFVANDDIKLMKFMVYHRKKYLKKIEKNNYGNI